MSRRDVESMDRAVDQASPVWPGHLADDLYVLAHDRPGHTSALASRALNLAIAGALLAELVLIDRVGVEAGRCWATHGRHGQPPPDSLMHEVLADLLSEPVERDLLTWLGYLARRPPEGAAGRVAQRLVRARVLTRQERRGLLRTTVRHVPVDGAMTGWRAVRLSYQATGREPVPPQDLTLVALVGATQLTRPVFGGHVHDPEAYVRRCTQALTPPLRELAEEVRAAIARAVTAPT
jgi:hypothetical protein